MMTGKFKSELATLTEYWSPKIVGQINDQYIKVAKLKGALVWHKHDDEDEMFYIVQGSLTIEYEDTSVTLSAGDFHVVPKGKMHNPVAETECWIVLIEPVTTRHTGDLTVAKTKSVAAQLRG